MFWRQWMGWASLLMSGVAWGVPVPNASFEEGKEEPLGWRLSGGQGRWEATGHMGRRCVSVTGNGQDSNAWICEGFRFKPNALYRVSVWGRSAPGASGGTAITGTDGVNRDVSFPSQWAQRAFILRTPQDANLLRLRFGQWHVKGTLLYDDVAVEEVQVLHRRVGNLELGEGERIQGGRYLFEPNWAGEGSNDSRCLQAFQAAFNTNRWVMFDGAWVLYRHRVGEYVQTQGKVSVAIGYYVGGRCVIQASRDGQQWLEVGTLEGLGERTFELPATLFPASEVWIRLLSQGKLTERGDTHPGEFQIHGYRYEAGLQNPPPDLRGATSYVSLLRTSPALGFTLVEMEPVGSLQEPAFAFRLSSRRSQPFPLRIELASLPEEGTPHRGIASLILPPRQERTVRMPYRVRSAGPHRLELTVREAKTGQVLLVASTSFSVPPLYLSGFGERLKEDATALLWWCGSTYKVSRTCPAPEGKGRAVRLSAARREYEPFQLVLRPKRDLKGVTVEVSPLRGPGGATLEARHISIHLVEYVFVQHPTDALGVMDWWPDPLPPYERPFAVKAEQNQPLWLTVFVPENQPAGLYRGMVRLRAEGWRQEVPLELRVWDFSLPSRPSLQSAFGFSVGWMKQYHHLETDEEVRQVFDLYMQNFREHRLCPYDPMALDPIRVRFGRGPWQGGMVVQEGVYQGRQSLRIMDTDPQGDVSAVNEEWIPIEPQAAYRLSWAVRTEKPGQSYMLTLATYDANRQWLWGRNVDLPFTGSGQWEERSIELQGRFAPEARFARLVLRPVLWTEKGENMGTAWFDSLSLVRLPDGKNLIADPDFEESTPPWDVALDFSAFDRAAQRYLDEFGFPAFRLPLVGMGGGSFYERRPGRIAGFEQGTPEYERIFGNYVRALQEHLEAKGWLGKEYIYWFDEPEPRDYPFVREGMERIHRHAPRLTRMLTEQPEPELYGAVDLWCPVTPNYNHKVAEERRKHGERFWWYVCTGPKAPYVGLFIDHHAIEMRMWLWQTVKYGIEGILVWQTNYWTSPAAYPNTWQNPWEDPMSYVSGYGTPPGTRRFWGNGDGRFFYPPCRNPLGCKEKHLTGPVSSFRWEMLREGMEDAEYFFLLRRLVQEAKKRGLRSEALRSAEALLTVPDEITRDLVHFTQDPRLLEAHREKMAQAIEAWQR